MVAAMANKNTRGAGGSAPGDLTGQLQKRLAFIEGQVRGVRGMVDNQRDPAEILIQLRAVEAAVGAAAALIVEDGVIGQIKQSIRELLAACAGSCDSCDQLEQIMAALDRLDYSALAGQLTQARRANYRLPTRK
jgi:DNA-binding FrmR family transcriptional regulator